MNYRKVYLSIISNAKQQQKEGLRPESKYCKDSKESRGIYEWHHVLPKSLFPNWEKRKSNIVPLTLKEHYFCHELLYKIYPGSKMSGAWFRMSTDGRHKITMREYEAAKKQYTFWCQKSRNGSSNGMYGKKWYNNGKEEILVFGVPPEGFVRGKISKNNNFLRKEKGYIWTNGKIETRSFEKPGEDFRRGSLKSLNRKYKPLSKETKKKLSVAKKGKPNLGSGQSCKGKHFYTNGVETIRAFECPEGYWLGRIWDSNKGKTFKKI